MLVRERQKIAVYWGMKGRFTLKAFKEGSFGTNDTFKSC